MWGAVVFLDTCVILCTVFSTAGATQQRQVQAQVGHSVKMQCVVPVPNITQWGTFRLFLQKRLPFSNPKVVFSFANGQEQPDHQDWAYKNRCRLSKGNLSLTLSHISPSDEGEYDCTVFLPKRWGYQLEYTGQLRLSTWADYSRPQISLFEGRDGALHTAVCSSNGGYPRGDVEWFVNPGNQDLRNKTETWADSDPRTLLYNVSGRLTLPKSATGSIHCCVVGGHKTVCGDKRGLSSELSGAGRGEPRRSTALICLALMMSLTLHTLQQVGAQVHAG
ncbi:T-lymphocyte activation antigen CD80 isoform X1 [Bufo bufo]|uniref:T-lymphocyte activation antigen CD80 isoform X1 n=1 Tax=Bufo bufo TaxID=8384 RepID=UPI001ABDB66D|nr:T-lymphocyte activation antigen CD80 isoform X1 [Bufo bufo]